jgi:hypothetical protein
MEYLGNYAELIQPEWIDFLIKNPGQLLPDNRECLLPDFHPQNVEIQSVWSNENKPKWNVFEIPDLPFTIPWPVKLGNNIDWWVIKMSPGQIMPMHEDPCPDVNHLQRYILALQDYEPGHVLIWDNQLVKDYKKGDLFRFKNPMAAHGGCNLSNTVRLLAYLSVYDAGVV